LERLENKHRLLFILAVFNIKSLFVPIFTLSGVFLCICGQKFKTYRTLSLHLYKNYLNLRMNTDKISTVPTIYIANYPENYIEYMTHGLITDKLCVLAVANTATKILKFVYGEDHAIYNYTGNFDKLKEAVRKKINEGYSIFCYSERNHYDRKNEYDLCEFRTGMFHIAKSLNVSVTPICVDHISHTFGILDDTIFKIHIGDSFYVTDVDKDIKSTHSFLKRELKKMKLKRLAKKE
jgi:hypothetical protein